MSEVKRPASLEDAKFEGFEEEAAKESEEVAKNEGGEIEGFCKKNCGNGKKKRGLFFSSDRKKKMDGVHQEPEQEAEEQTVDQRQTEAYKQGEELDVLPDVSEAQKPEGQQRIWTEPEPQWQPEPETDLEAEPEIACEPEPKQEQEEEQPEEMEVQEEPPGQENQEKDLELSLQEEIEQQTEEEAEGTAAEQKQSQIPPPRKDVEEVWPDDDKYGLSEQAQGIGTVTLLDLLLNDPAFSYYIEFAGIPMDVPFICQRMEVSKGFQFDIKEFEYATLVMDLTAEEEELLRIDFMLKTRKAMSISERSALFNKEARLLEHPSNKILSLCRGDHVYERVAYLNSISIRDAANFITSDYLLPELKAYLSEGLPLSVAASMTDLNEMEQTVVLQLLKIVNPGDLTIQSVKDIAAAIGDNTKISIEELKAMVEAEKKPPYENPEGEEDKITLTRREFNQIISDCVKNALAER